MNCINSITYGNDAWTCTTTEEIIKYKTDAYISAGIQPQPSKHFNCKKCGATNQVDVCEYCGSVFEEGAE